MSYGTDGLTYNVLRAANLQRIPLFKDKKGRLAHPKIEGQPVGFDWPLSKWSNAVFGEGGEAANVIKKIERGDFDLEDEGVREMLGKELADVAIYLDILAHRAGVNLGRAIIDKFNEVSERQDISIRIREDGSDWMYSKGLGVPQ